MVFLSYLILGALAGTLAGLFGIGGGLIIVPALVFSFEIQGLPSDILTHLAVGTSLATIAVTSLSSIRAHHAKGSVCWPIFLLMTIGILLGAWFGVYTAIQMTGEVLRKTIGIFAILMAIKMWIGFKVREGSHIPSRPTFFSAGIFIGWASTIFGIGGGTLSVPFLRKSNLQMPEAVGTSAACGLPIALMGALANMLMGQGNDQLPAMTTGYVYWPAFLGIVLTSMLFARYGARLAHHLSAERLQKLFAVFLLLVGVEFLIL
ncbi:sulfite exporter TauE/SafE family protein [Endozoicomonas euniceicola]|uniref:Probable membrane transporter protein n=1 Tax=Endozoicomonas euniceicola TaxID=1234143 RepID=A0ABY6GWY2_9GAMM|nr:sulfite exporter TauE/SafE family protein [Endozoicomonas euniceicola]UYM17287.1 sulfite exporter TauE/SafE family protein [Endozoicomonas euniceicola]